MAVAIIIVTCKFTLKPSILVSSATTIQVFKIKRKNKFSLWRSKLNVRKWKNDVLRRTKGIAATTFNLDHTYVLSTLYRMRTCFYVCACPVIK